MPKNDLLETYYDLFDLFGSIEVLAVALKELQGVKMCKSMVIGHLEETRLYHFDLQLNSLYDMPMDDLRKFRVKCLAHGTQLDIWDFM